MERSKNKDVTAKAAKAVKTTKAVKAAKPVKTPAPKGGAPVRPTQTDESVITRSAGTSKRVSTIKPAAKSVSTPAAPIAKTPVEPVQKEQVLPEPVFSENFDWNLILDQKTYFHSSQIEKEQNLTKQNEMSRLWRLILDVPRLKKIPRLSGLLGGELRKTGISIIDSDIDNFVILLPEGYPDLLPLGFIKARILPLDPEKAFKKSKEKLPIWNYFELEKLAYTPADLDLMGPDERKDKESQWDMRISLTYMKATGKSYRDIQQLLNQLKLKVLDLNEGWFRVQVPSNISQSPSQYVAMFIELQKGLYNPRYLTPEEINNILMNIPKIESPDPVAGENARQEMIKKLRGMLRTEKITPLGIEILKNIMVQRFYQSKISPGKSVGVTTAEALGQPLTQMALKSFHKIGSAKSATQGVPAIAELLHISPVRKSESCTIYFKNQNLSYDNIVIRGRSIIETSVTTVLLNFEVLSGAKLQTEWWHSAYQEVRGSFYQDHPKNTSKKDLNEVSWFLRLYLVVDILYANQVTTEDVAAAFDKKKDDALFVIPSPTHIGIIDIFPIEDQVKIILPDVVKESKHKEEEVNKIGERVKLLPISAAVDFFLSNIVVPTFDKLYIKGIPGIKRIFPADAQTLSIIRSQEKIYTNEHLFAEKDLEKRDEMSRMWYLFFNRAVMIRTGIPVSKLRALVDATGLIYHSEDEDRMIVIMPKDIPEELLREDEKKPEKEKKNYGLPSGWMGHQIKEDEKAKKKDEETIRKRDNNSLYNRPPSKIERAARLYYAETDGSNLGELLSRPDIDSTRTSSNNIHQMHEVFGIEVARNLLIREFDAVIKSSGSSINQRHLVLLGDFMTVLGYPTPISYAGIAAQPTGFLTKSSYQRSMDEFNKAAAFGRSEKISSVTPAIFTGQRAKIGTGYSEIITNEKMIRDYERKAKLQEKATGKPAIVSAKEFTDLIKKTDFGEAVYKPLIVAQEGLNNIQNLLNPILLPPSELGPATPEVLETDPTDTKVIPIKTAPVRPGPLESVYPLVNEIEPLPRKIDMPRVEITHIKSEIKDPLERKVYKLPPITTAPIGQITKLLSKIKAAAPEVAPTPLKIDISAEAVTIAAPSVKITLKKTRPLGTVEIMSYEEMLKNTF